MRGGMEMEKPKYLIGVAFWATQAFIVRKSPRARERTGPEYLAPVAGPGSHGYSWAPEKPPSVRWLASGWIDHCRRSSRGGPVDHRSRIQMADSRLLPIKRRVVMLPIDRPQTEILRLQTA